MNRESFLSNVRQAAEAGRAYRVHLHPVPPEVGYVGVAGDLCEKMAAEVDAVGGKSYRVSDIAAARDVLADLLDEAEAKSALCWKHELLIRLGLSEQLQARGVAPHDY